MTPMKPLLAALNFENVGRPWLWIVLAAAGAAVLFVTYLGIFQRSERRLTWFLMLLRAGGLLALLLALAKPTWTSETELTDSGRLVVVLDNSRSMSLPDPGGKPRYELAKEAVARLKERFAARPSGPRLEVDVFDVNGAFLDKGVPDQPTVDRTDLVRGLSEAAAQLRSKLVADVVLISDGMDNTGRQDFAELAGLTVPVDTLGFRSDADAAGLDLAMREPHAPARVMVHNEIQVDVPVTKTGGPATEATVFIKRGEEQFASQKISLPAGNGEQVVSLNMTPREPGDFVFTASVEAAAGEKYLANNAAHFPLRVEKEKIKVFYVEGFLRFEFKFLKDRLEEDPDVDLVTVVRRTNPDQAESKNGKDLLTPERLKNLDVVILGDMEAGYLSGPEHQALVQWLEDKKHHALLVLGGYRSFGPDGFHSTPLADVLPVEFADKPPYQSEDPFTLQLTEPGRHHPIFELSSDRVKNEAAWNAAPPLLGSSLVKRAKPAAEVLAVNKNVVIDGQPAVVVATQRFGGGHTMVVAADTTWRWSRLPRMVGQADTLYARFWSQTIRWLSGRGLDDQRPLLAVSTDRPDYDVSKKVSIRVVRQPRPDNDLASSSVGVAVVGPAGKAVPVQAQANSAEPDVFTGSFYPSEGGKYQVAASLTAGDTALANQTSEFLVHGSDLELADPRTNPETLKSIARITGGRYFSIEDVDQLAEKIVPRERKTTRVQRSEFWNSPVLFFFFLAAVTAEWFIRRRNHLV